MTADDDIRALQRSLREPAAFDVLFVRHHVAIRRYLHARTSQPAVAEDLAAETFVRAFAARAQFRDQGHGVRAWLFQIAMNLLRDETRAEGHRGERYRRLAVGDDAAAAPSLPSDPQLSARLRELPRVQLEVLLLYAWADLSYAEIALALGVRVGTVRSRLHRARTQLRHDLSTTDPAPAPVRAEGSPT
jgi:RNA polymerase sigma-70 factor (ECF subfamily)